MGAFRKFVGLKQQKTSLYRLILALCDTWRSFRNSPEIEAVVGFLAILDLEQCRCYTAHKYNYQTYFLQTKLIFAEGIRHPLIEHLQTRETYVTNDLSLGDETLDGVLLYEINAVGKTSLIKAVGIAIIMAQAGPTYLARDLTHHIPKFSLNPGADNIFKGLPHLPLKCPNFAPLINLTKTV